MGATCVTVDEHSRSIARAETQATIDAASDAFGRGSIDDAEWQRRVTSALARAYLRESDPRWQSGFDGDAALWREARDLILQAVPRDGTLLDVGCANGHLLECLGQWASERGRRLSLFGLELQPGLAAAARDRLPAMADHIFVSSRGDRCRQRGGCDGDGDRERDGSQREDSSCGVGGQAREHCVTGTGTIR